jgi:hypothetical protein
MTLGVDSASNRNEYQEYFLGGKGGRCVRLTTLPPSCAVVTKSGRIDFLEPSGPVEACNGTALPLYLYSPHLLPDFGEILYRKSAHYTAVHLMSLWFKSA